MNTPNPPKKSYEWDDALIARYNLNGPRYTSYPTALSLCETSHTSLREEALLLTDDSAPLSLYVHLPFCAVLCYFCACNKIVTRNKERVAHYLRALEEEILSLTKTLKGRRLAQLHFGGGTPNFLESEQMRDLLSVIFSVFSREEGMEMSIELDPRTLGAEKFEAYLDLGFNRLSFGVQDFEPKVQKAVNRDQSLDRTESLMHIARARGIHSIHLDVIYGLPHQSEASFRRTIQTLIDLSPSRLSLFNFAYLPSRFPAQKLIPKESLPTPGCKLSILKESMESLEESGYRLIGMDHFAKADDPLFLAQKAGKLQRNFQGYTTHGGLDLIGVGVSSISQIGRLISQNHKDIANYQSAINAGNPPLEKALLKTDEDLLRWHIIESLLCHFALDIKAFEARFEKDFFQHFAPEVERLAPLLADSLATLTKESLTLTKKGRLLSRVVAMVFDAHSRSGESRFSKVI